MKRSFPAGKALLATTLALTLSLPVTAYAEGNTTTDSKTPTTTMPPLDVENASVPLRQITDLIGATITWHAADQKIVIEHDTATVEFKIGDQNARVDGTSTPLEGTASLVNGKTHIPLRFLNNTFGVQIAWNPNSKQATLNKMPAAVTAQHFVSMLSKGKYEAAHKLLNESMQKILPVNVMSMQAGGLLQVYGKFEKVLVTDVQKNAVHETVNLVYQTEKVPQDIQGKRIQVSINFDANGKIDNLLFGNDSVTLPNKYTLPAYAKPESYTTQEMVIGAGTAWPLPGTLTLPKAEGKSPLVILVQGSGHGDRDSSIGESNKLFRDLATGLASQGIAALSYDKRNLVHSMRFYSSNPTMKEETVDDALEAVKWARTQPGIDPDRIFVLGHSLGGMQLPNMIEADTEHHIAGGISFAGPSTPLEDILFNFDHLISVGIATVDMKAALEHDVKLLQDPAYDPNKPSEPSHFFSPGEMKSLHNYKPAEVVKKQTTPYLFLQGGKDHQVPVFDFENWKKVLGDRPNTTYRLYDNLTHMFFEYNQEGFAHPKEYLVPNHIPEYVINDISTWVKATGSNK